MKNVVGNWLIADHEYPNQTNHVKIKEHFFVGKNKCVCGDCINMLLINCSTSYSNVSH